MHSRRGFSFLELIVLVVIFGILAAIAIPSFKKARRAAQANQAEAGAPKPWGRVVHSGSLYSSEGWRYRMATIEYRGHLYVAEGDAALCHSPDCPCHKGEKIGWSEGTAEKAVAKPAESSGREW